MSGRVAWLLGSEGSGVSEELLRKCSLLARVPMPGGMESLNVAATAAICFYEAMRQRIRLEERATR